MNRATIIRQTIGLSKKTLPVFLGIAIVVSMGNQSSNAQRVDSLCGGAVVVPEGFPTPPPVTSQINAAAIPGVIQSISAYFTDFIAPRPDDLDMILIHPNGTANLEIWSDVGGINPLNLTGFNVDVDDAAGALLPDDGPIVGGASYMPSDVGLVGTTPAAYGLAPAFVISHAAPNGGATFASEFNGLSPNGTWELRAVDDTGTLNGPEASFADWCLVITSGDQVLPVELATFQAIASDSDVILNWETSSETSNAGFEIQRLGTEDYETVAFVEGSGTTTTPTQYRYVIEDLAPGPYTYRLKQVDFDGAFEYSHSVEVFVEIPGGYEVSSLYPNPFQSSSEFTVILGETQNIQIVIYDVTGRSVGFLHDGLLSAEQTHRFTFESNGLPGGTYFVRVIGGTFSETKRVMLAP